MPVEGIENSPLQGVSAETLLTELVDFYGWEILYAALGLKCFQIKPTIPSSLTFLKKTEWARNKVEGFYLYRFKRMPKDRDQFDLKPRERGFAEGVVQRDPIPLTVEMIEGMKAQSENSYKSRRPHSRD